MEEVCFSYTQEAGERVSFGIAPVAPGQPVFISPEYRTVKDFK